MFEHYYKNESYQIFSNIWSHEQPAIEVIYKTFMAGCYSIWKCSVILILLTDYLSFRALYL